MFNYLLKSIPAEYIFFGYNVKKGLTVMTTDTENGVYYDIFIYSYIDNHISFYILMDDGTYQYVETKERFPALENKDIISRHMFRGNYYDTREYGEFDKDKIIGVYGLRGIMDLMKQVDEQEKEQEAKNMSLLALLDEKAAYTGMEIGTAIKRFNKNLNRINGYITVPPIKKDEKDSFESIIGDEEAWNAFCEGKTSDEIVAEIKKLDDESRAAAGSVDESGLNDLLQRK